VYFTWKSAVQSKHLQSHAGKIKSARRSKETGQSSNKGIRKANLNVLKVFIICVKGAEHMLPAACDAVRAMKEEEEEKFKS